MAYLPGQQYIQNASGVWTSVGYASGNLAVPVSNSLTPAGTVGAASGNVGAPFYATGTAAQAATVVIAAPGAGLSIYVTDMEGSNEGATGTAIAFLEGTTVTKYRRFIAATGGGFVTNLKTPWKLPNATALGSLITASTTWNYTINYYIAA